MIKNTVIDRCLKSQFKTFEQIGEKRYILRWGKEDEIIREFVINELTGEPEFTGEVRDTDWCTYETGLYEGILNVHMLDRALKGRTRIASIQEYKEFYDKAGAGIELQVSKLKEKLKEQIHVYDKSNAVEDFSIGDVHLWLNSELRNKVRENLEVAQQKNETELVLRYNGLSFPMTVTTGWQLYYAVLDYARATWNVTETHLANVNKLSTIEDILKYDYTADYPDKLAF